MTTPSATRGTLLPGWYRGVLIALATVLMCSCRAQTAKSQEPPELEAYAATGAPAYGGEVGSPSDACATGPSGPCGPAGCPLSEAPAGDAPCAACPVYPCNEPLWDEWLCDGGDSQAPVGVRADWTLDGLDQEDTVAHYDDLCGRVLVQPSNRLCIYAPRFAAVRRVVSPMGSEQKVLVNIFEEDRSPALAREEALATTALQRDQPYEDAGQQPPNLLRERQQAGQFEGRLVVREVKNLIRPYCDFQVIKLGVVEMGEKPWLAQSVVAALTYTGDQAPQVVLGGQAASVLIGEQQPGVVYQSPEGKPCIRLIKCASKGNALPGEVVEFTLRFDNIGSQVMGNVTIVDNLTTRLEYVPESAEASVKADFSTSKNAAGSLILRWEVVEPVEAGKGGVLTFKARVL